MQNQKLLAGRESDASIRMGAQQSKSKTGMSSASKKEQFNDSREQDLQKAGGSGVVHSGRVSTLASSSDPLNKFFN